MDAKAENETARDKRRPNGVLSEHPEDLLFGSGWRAVWAVLREAILRLWNDDAMGLAGNIAFRAVLAIFPFLIFASSLTAFIGNREMADGLVAAIEDLEHTRGRKVHTRGRHLAQIDVRLAEGLHRPLLLTDRV